jgi:hypothetical protein
MPGLVRASTSWRHGARKDVDVRETLGHDEQGASRAMTATRNYFGCGTIRIYGFGDFQPCG